MKNWASWDPVLLTLTVSRPSGLTHEQLEEIWSPCINQAFSDKLVYEINQKIQAAIHESHLRAAQEREDQRRLQEIENQRRREEATKAEETRRRTAEERLRAEQLAKEKAEALLLRSLTDQQKEDLRTKDYFHVESGGSTIGRNGSRNSFFLHSPN